MVTFAAPWRRLVREQSMAVEPPPMTTTSRPTSSGSPRLAFFMKSTPYWMPSRSPPGMSRPTAFMAPAQMATAAFSGPSRPPPEPHAHLDRLPRQAEGGHADEHRAAGVGQVVVDGHLVAGHGQLAGDGQTGRPGADHGPAPAPRGDDRHP